MAKYRVLRDKGFPVDAPKYAFGEEFESAHVEDAAGVASGYLELIEAPKVEEKPAKKKPAPQPEPDPHD